MTTAGLPGYLRLGDTVLDVGCGTGAITAGIARQVGAAGLAVGIDRDQSLLTQHPVLPNLRFLAGDATALPFRSRFDVVTAARTLQWLSDPGLAVRRMSQAARPGGTVVVLDYNHRDNSWTPEPPAEFARFYQAFLDWRAANDWDNEMADHLPALFHAAGLSGVEDHVDDEVTHRGDAEFLTLLAIWSHVIADVGPRIVAAGFLSESERLAAAGSYQSFAASRAEPRP